MAIEVIERGQLLLLTKGTPLPFICPECDGPVPVASLDGKHAGVDRFAEFITCPACQHFALRDEFEVEWEFRGLQ